MGEFDHKFDDIFKDGLKDFELSPGNNLWEGIANEIPTKQPERIKPVYLMLASFIFMGLGLVYFFSYYSIDAKISINKKFPDTAIASLNTEHIEADSNNGLNTLKTIKTTKSKNFDGSLIFDDCDLNVKYLLQQNNNPRLNPSQIAGQIESNLASNESELLLASVDNSKAPSAYINKSFSSNTEINTNANTDLKNKKGSLVNFANKIKDLDWLAFVKQLNKYRSDQFQLFANKRDRNSNLIKGYFSNSNSNSKKSNTNTNLVAAEIVEDLNNSNGFLASNDKMESPNHQLLEQAEQASSNFPLLKNPMPSNQSTGWYAGSFAQYQGSISMSKKEVNPELTNTYDSQIYYNGAYGVLLGYNFNENFGIQTEVALNSIQGDSRKYSSINNETTNILIKNEYFKIPLLLKYRYQLNNNSKTPSSISHLLGLQYGYLKNQEQLIDRVAYPSDEIPNRNNIGIVLGLDYNLLITKKTTFAIGARGTFSRNFNSFQQFVNFTPSVDVLFGLNASLRYSFNK